MIKVLDTLYMMLVRLTIQWWNKRTQAIEKELQKKVTYNHINWNELAQSFSNPFDRTLNT